MQFPSAASQIDEGSACSPRSLVASTGPSGPATISDREYNFGPQHARSTRSTPSTPPVEWYNFSRRR